MKPSITRLAQTFLLCVLPFQLIYGQYCIPTATFGITEVIAINYVEINTDPSSYKTYSFNQGELVNNNYSIENSRLSLVPGQSCEISVSVLGVYDEMYYHIWVDFNSDGDFIDEGEKVGVVTASSSYVESSVLAFTIPTSVTLGSQSRIRITGAYLRPNIGPCDSYEYGETLDIEVAFGEFKTSTSDIWGNVVAIADLDQDGFEDYICYVGGDPFYGGYELKLYKNNGEGGSSTWPTDLFSYSDPVITLCDFDNDNDVDLVMSGDQPIGDFNFLNSTALYRNAGNFTFEFIRNEVFPIDSKSSPSFGDYDQDGDQDIFIIKDEAESIKAYLYINNEQVYADSEIQFPNIGGKNARWGDFDNDGDPDLVVNGSIGNGPGFVQIYKNMYPGFITLDLGIGIEENSSFEWGDFDNDGDLDILCTGLDELIIENLGNDQFSTFQGINTQSEIKHAKWGDYDIDGDLDIICSDGIYESLNGINFSMINNSYLDFQRSIHLIDLENDNDLDFFLGSERVENVTLWQNNQLPSQPNGLSMSQRDKEIILSWNPSHDDISAAATIQYNVSLKDASGNFIVAPGAAWQQGNSFYRKDGNAFFANEFKIMNLDPGSYTWGVQSIDNSGLNSAFRAAGEPFQVLPMFTFLNSDQLIDGSRGVSWGDYDNDGDLDLCEHGKIYRNNGSSLSLVYDLVEATILEGVTHSEWVDYDNDGDLDISFHGHYTGYGMYQQPEDFTSFFVFQNNNGNFSELCSLDYTAYGAGYDGEFYWIDVNSDGRKDLLVDARDHLLYSTQSTALHKNTEMGLVRDYGFAINNHEKGDFYFEDIDGDMDIDMIFNGLGGVRTLFNDGTGKFFDVAIGIGVVEGEFLFGDYDNDNDIDILVNGDKILRNSNLQFKAVDTDFYTHDGYSTFWMDMDGDYDLDLLKYGGAGALKVLDIRNKGNDRHETYEVLDLANTKGDLCLWDIDGDWDLDILFAGSYEGTNSFVTLRNNYNNGTGPPGKASNLSHELEEFDVILNWDRPKLEGQPDHSVSFDVRIGTSPGLSDVVSPDSDPNTGLLRTPHRGNASISESFRIKGLPEGTYYWSVLSINNSQQTSGWASEAAFTLNSVRPDFSVDTVCLGTNTDFIDLSSSTSTIDTWNWDFGDGFTSNLQEPLYEFSTSGFHYVTLTAGAQNGDISSVTRKVYVKEKPDVYYVAEPVCDRKEMMFEDLSSYGGLSGINYIWTFGDGDISLNQSSISHLYLSPDTYTTSLTITADNGCSNRLTQKVTMAEYPDANISLEPGYDIDFCSDDSTILAVPDNASYQYQWQLNGVNIFGETEHAITVKGPKGEYSVLVENPVSGCISEDSIMVIIRSAPAHAEINIIGSNEFCERDSAMLYISDSPGMSYQWLLNGGELGNDEHIYFAKDDGYYTCVRSNEFACSSTSSNGEDISVIPGPDIPILLLSGSTLFCEEQTLTLNISDPGTDAYQWMKDDIPIVGMTGTNLTIDETGHFKVRASNGSCESFSQEIVTTVSSNPKTPVIQTENYEEGDCQGEDPITLKVETIGNSFFYQWKRNGLPISGANGSSYTEFLAEGEYSVEVIKNGCGTESAVLTIEYGEMPEKPEIIVKGPPVWYLFCSNENASEYRWYFNEERIQDANEALYVVGSREGRFEVAISDGSICFSRSDPVWIPLSTEIEGDPFSGLIIYPNPTPGVVSIEMENDLMGELIIDVFTEQGSKILNARFLKQTSHFVAQVDLSDQPAGMYLIDLISGEKRIQKKLVVE